MKKKKILRQEIAWSILKTLMKSAWLKGIEDYKTCLEKKAGARL